MIPTTAIAHLRQDATLNRAISTIELKVEPRDTDDVYLSLLRAICAQQLSAKAAKTIFKRFIDLFETGYPAPEVLLSLDTDTLRSVGLSKPKAGYIQNVATYFEEERLLDAEWDGVTDEEMIQKLTTIKGVGKWTVQMILIFSLGRMDVFPIDDLVIRQSMIDLYDVNPTLKGKALYQKLTEIAENWRPYRSVASRYLWKWNR